MTYKEYLEDVKEATEDFDKKMSDDKQSMASVMYEILTNDHIGESNAICAAQLSKEMGVKLGKEITPAHVSTCGKLFRARKKFIGFQSSVHGYFVDISFGCMVKTMRWFVDKAEQSLRSAENIRSIIIGKYGPDAVPVDIREFNRRLHYEEYCKANGIEPKFD